MAGLVRTVAREWESKSEEWSDSLSTVNNIDSFWSSPLLGEEWEPGVRSTKGLVETDGKQLFGTA